MERDLKQVIQKGVMNSDSELGHRLDPRAGQGEPHRYDCPDHADAFGFAVGVIKTIDESVVTENLDLTEDDSMLPSGCNS